MDIVSIVFLLLVAHALADFPLQGDATAINKNPNANTPLQKHVPWYYWLGSHAIIHGGGVALVTGSVFLGVLETIAHFFIDLGKCKNYLSIHQDQLLHILCKAVWVVILFGFLK
jgi:hypothetical protein